MRVLLDTNIVLWWLANDPSLPARASTVIADAETEVVVSAATVWEIEIKRAAGRLEAPDDIVGALVANDFDTLSITPAHAITAGRLPAHHSDPFDRMLIAQAQIEGFTFITADSRLSDYDVEFLPIN